MVTSISLKLLATASSQVTKKEIFNKRTNVYIPDFFFIFLYLTTFLSSAALERILILSLLSLEKRYAIGGLFFATFLAPILYYVLLENDYYDQLPECKLNPWLRTVFYLFLIICGLDSALIGGKVIIRGFIRKNTSEEYFPQRPHLFFHIPDEDLSLVKFYCCFNSVFKSMPQFFMTCIYLLDIRKDTFTAYVATASIFINMIIFSLTMAVTLPFRKIPRIYTSCCCVLLNSFSKFMATMCSCGMNLTLFAMIYEKQNQIAFIVPILRFISSVWPCWRIFKTQKFPILYLIFYGIFFSAMFSFIFIHPFEDKGKMFYCYFYLVNFSLEIASIYLLTDAVYDKLIVFYVLRILTIGFLSCFGLINFHHKDKIRNFQDGINTVENPK